MYVFLIFAFLFIYLQHGCVRLHSYKYIRNVEVHKPSFNLSYHYTQPISSSSCDQLVTYTEIISNHIQLGTNSILFSIEEEYGIDKPFNAKLQLYFWAHRISIALGFIYI